MLNAPKSKDTPASEDENRVVFDGRMHRIMGAFAVRSDSELARGLGIKPQSVAAARQRLQIPTGWIEKTSILTETPTDWLFFGRGPLRYDSTPPSAGLVQGCAQNIAHYSTQQTTLATAHPHLAHLAQGHLAQGPHDELVMIPRVAPHLAAGTNSLVSESQMRGHYAFRADWVKRKGSASHMALMNVTGDSMLPRIEDGDMVLIDQSKTDITAYGIYAVGVENSVYIKQLHTRPGQLILHSLNPAYEDIIININAEQPECARILGRVLWIGRDLL